MTLHSSPSLTRASLLLDQSLDDLDLAVTERNALEKRLEQSRKKVTTVMKTLARRWDKADFATYGKLHTKHANLQKSLSRAQARCNAARQKFQDMRDEYDAVRDRLTARMRTSSVEFDQLQRCQGGMSRVLGHFVDRIKSGAHVESAGAAYDVHDGAYDYIPYDVPGFLALLVRLDELLGDDPDYAAEDRPYRPVSFLEIGCGPGRNIVIARSSKLVNFSRLAGFEINPDQVELGKRAFGLTKELQVADAMSFDFSPWDVVFSFRPFSDNILQIDLEAHIVGSMRKSAYLLAPLSQDLGLYRDLTRMGLRSDIWKKTGDSIPPPPQTA